MSSSSISPLLLRSSASSFTFLALFFAAFATLLRLSFLRLRLRFRLLTSPPPAPPPPPPLSSSSASPNRPLLRHRHRLPSSRLLPCKSIPSSLDKIQSYHDSPLDLLSCVLEIPALRRIASASRLLDAAAAAEEEEEPARLFLASPPPLSSLERLQRVGAIVNEDDERRFEARDSAVAVDSSCRKGESSAGSMKGDRNRRTGGGMAQEAAPSLEEQWGWDKLMKGKMGGGWEWEWRGGANEEEGMGVVRLWKSEERRKAALLESLGLEGAASMEAVGLSTDRAKILVAESSGGGGQRVVLWDVASASYARVIGDWAAPPLGSALCIDSDRGLLLSAAGNGQLRLSDLKSRSTIRSVVKNIPWPAAIECRGDYSLYFRRPDSHHDDDHQELDLRKLSDSIPPPSKPTVTTTLAAEEEEECWSLLWECLQTTTMAAADPEEEDEEEEFLHECASNYGAGNFDWQKSSSGSSLVWRCAGLLRSMAA